MSTESTKKALSRHGSIGLQQQQQQQPQQRRSLASGQRSSTSAQASDTKSHSVVRRRQTLTSIPVTAGQTNRRRQQTKVEGSNPVENVEKETVDGSQEEPKLFDMEKWLHYVDRPMDEGQGEELKGDGKNIPPHPEVLEERRPTETVVIGEDHRQIIRHTWAIVAGQMAANGCQIFLRIFELSPGIKRVFGFGPEMSGTDIISHPNLVRHASRFMEAMESAVEHLDELETIVSPVFINLGKAHAYFKDIREGYFNIFAGAILFAWRQALGDSFSLEVRAAWSRLFDYILQRLKFGYQLEMADIESRSKESP